MKFSTYLSIIVKNTLWDPTKYIYLESARRDPQNGLKKFLQKKNQKI